MQESRKVEAGEKRLTDVVTSNTQKGQKYRGAGEMDKGGGIHELKSGIR